MLVVTNNGQTEPLINIQNAEVTEAINDDSQEFSFRFSTFLTDKNQYGYDLLQDESIVDLDGQEFRVKQLNEIRNHKDVVALHVFFDLVEAPRKEDIYGGTHTADEVFTWLLDATGWTHEVVDDIDATLFDNFGDGSILALIWQACNILGCEIRILPGRHIEIYKQIGSETDNQFRFKSNIKTLKKSIDTTNFFTAIRGFGANGLEVTYISPNAVNYGERWAEPVKDDRYTSSDSLTKVLQQTLQDEPLIGYEIEVTKLDFDVSLGDRIWTIYEPMNIDIKTRIMAYKWYPFSKKAPAVTIGNKKKTLTDVLTQTNIDIKENQKEYRSKIDQTNEQITLEVDRLDGDIADANASIQLNADSIASKVESTTYESGIADAKSYADTQASNAQDGAKQYTDDSLSPLNQRVTTNESSITQLADSITSKVSSTDFNGNTIASLINQTATTIDIEADKINFVGHVFGQDATFTGDISGGSISSNTTINVTTDLTVGRFINMGGTSDSFQSRINLGLGAYLSGYYNVTLHGDAWITVDADNDIRFSNNGSVKTSMGSNGFISWISESGYCAAGGYSPSSSGTVAANGVNFKMTKNYTPSSVSLSTISSNCSASYANLDAYGFYFYISSGGTANAYYQWRGHYSA